MMDNIKVFRQSVRNMGYADEHYYIRIRPEERDGSWRIRADVKAKNSNERFFNVAAFDIPPLDNSLKTNCAGWENPVWKRTYPQTQPQGEDEDEDEEDEMESGDPDAITAEDLMYNM
jgi:hypothetical protein